MIFAPQILPFDVQAMFINPSKTILHTDAMRLEWTGFNIPSAGGLIHLDQSFSFPPLINIYVAQIFFKKS